MRIFIRTVGRGAAVIWLLLFATACSLDRPYALSIEEPSEPIVIVTGCPTTGSRLPVVAAMWGDGRVLRIKSVPRQLVTDRVLETKEYETGSVADPTMHELIRLAIVGARNVRYGSITPGGCVHQLHIRFSDGLFWTAAINVLDREWPANALVQALLDVPLTNVESQSGPHWFPQAWWTRPRVN